LKQTNVSKKTLPSRNLGSNKEELHTLTSTPKKTKGDMGTGRIN
jgi:hypothetical protein